VPSTEPTNNLMANLILKAIRLRYISSGISPTRVIHIKTMSKLVIRHTKVGYKTLISHDGLLLHLLHNRNDGFAKDAIKVIPLGDPELITKTVEWIAEGD